MSKRLMLAVAVVLVVSCTIGVAIAVGQGGSDDNTLIARLRGANESPRGDSNGRGIAAVLLSGSQVCVSVSYSGLATVAAFHIHKGRRGTNGGIVVDPKFPGGGAGVRGTLGACVAPSSGTTVSQIRRNPGQYYVNVHTSEFPAGAIRGQLQRP